MNVLLVSDASVERTGVCMFMLNWATGIKKNYPNAVVVSYFRKEKLNDEVKKHYNDNGIIIEVGDLPQNSSSLSKGNIKKVRNDIRQIILKYNINILHVNSSAAGFSATVLKEGKNLNVPIRISHSHGKNTGNGLKELYLWFLKRRIKEYATTYAGCSLDAGRYLFGEDGINSKKWHFIPNTINTSVFAFNSVIRDEYRNKLCLTDDEILIGAVGMLIELKNHIFLLPIIKNLNNKGLKAKLIIFGEGNQKEIITSTAEEMGIKNSVFLPGVSDEIFNWLSAMDFYVMPSFSEGLPLGAVEAQSNGLYCLLSDKIPRDVDLCEDVYHLPIDQGTELWEVKISTLTPKSTEKRQEGVKIVRGAGFDNNKMIDFINVLYKL